MVLVIVEGENDSSKIYFLLSLPSALADGLEN
jgi:hypothetical protein